MAIAGVVLLVIGLLMAVSEAHVPTHGVAGGVGTIVAAVGLALTLSGLGTGAALGVAGGVGLAAAGAGMVALTVQGSVGVRRRRVRTGAEGLIGQIGIVRSWESEMGCVSLEGAVWRARRSPQDVDGEEHELHRGDPVVVERLTGLTLSVRPAEDWELVS